jgi:hypothetical protein
VVSDTIVVAQRDNITDMTSARKKRKKSTASDLTWGCTMVRSFIGEQANPDNAVSICV